MPRQSLGIKHGVYTSYFFRGIATLTLAMTYFYVFAREHSDRGRLDSPTPFRRANARHLPRFIWGVYSREGELPRTFIPYRHIERKRNIPPNNRQRDISPPKIILCKILFLKPEIRHWVWLVRSKVYLSAE